MELWHCADTRSFRVLWALEEIGVSYKVKLMHFPPRIEEPGYLNVNPLGTVPAFRDENVFMSESTAIVHYLAEKYAAAGLGLKMGDLDYPNWLNWMYFSDATLTFPQTIVLRYGTFEPGRADNAVSDYTRWFLSRLKHVDRQLLRASWLCADRFSAADIAVGYALLLADYLGLTAHFPDSVRGYWTRLRELPSFQSAKRIQKFELADLLAPPSSDAPRTPMPFVRIQGKLDG